MASAENCCVLPTRDHKEAGVKRSLSPPLLRRVLSPPRSPLLRPTRSSSPVVSIPPLPSCSSPKTCRRLATFRSTPLRPPPRNPRGLSARRWDSPPPLVRWRRSCRSSPGHGFSSRCSRGRASPTHRGRGSCASSPRDAPATSRSAWSRTPARHWRRTRWG